MYFCHKNRVHSKAGLDFLVEELTQAKVLRIVQREKFSRRLDLEVSFKELFG